MLKGNSLVPLEQKKRKLKEKAYIDQDYDNGGIRIPGVDFMIKAMRLAWIPRLLKHGNLNWKLVPDFYLRKLGGLNFLLYMM